MASEFCGRGLGGTVCLPPQVGDVREFQWLGFLAEVRYSFYLGLPFDMAHADYAVRKQVAKATRLGYECERTTSAGDICLCLEDTESRQGFVHKLDAADLSLATRLLGDDVLRCYACYAPNGEVASAMIVLRYREQALGWVGGTVKRHLANGVTQLLISFVLDDLGRSGAVSFDYCGANIRSIAASKAAWGGQLVPYYAISAPDLKGLARFMLRTMPKYRKWLQW
jgi:hypothetical protein